MQRASAGGVFSTKSMKILGALLIAFGTAALAFGGFSTLKREKVLDLGRVEVERTERETFPIPPLVGGAALIVGTLLVALPMRRRTV